MRPIVWRIPEDGNGDPKYRVALSTLTFLGNEARPFSPLAYDFVLNRGRFAYSVRNTLSPP